MYGIIVLSVLIINQKAMKRTSSRNEHFRELPQGARQHGKYGELILELCAWTDKSFSRAQRITCRYQGKALSCWRSAYFCI